MIVVSDCHIILIVLQTVQLKLLIYKGSIKDLIFERVIIPLKHLLLQKKG